MVDSQHVNESALVKVAIDAVAHFLALWVALTALFEVKLNKVTHKAVQGNIQGRLEHLLHSTLVSLTKRNAAGGGDALSCVRQSELRRAAQVAMVIGSKGAVKGDTVTGRSNSALLHEAIGYGVAAPLVIVTLLGVVLKLYRDRALSRCQLSWFSEQVKESQDLNQLKSLSIQESRCNFEIPWGEIGLSCGVMLAAVSAYEYYFVTHVATSYCPIKASTIVHTALRRAEHRLAPTAAAAPPLTQVPDPPAERVGWCAGAVAMVLGSGWLLARCDRDARNNRDLPELGRIEHVSIALVTALCIGGVVTAVYFTKAEDVESRQMKRQVERCVDTVVERHRAITSVAVCPEEARRLNAELHANVVKELHHPPNTAAAQREIDRHNAALIHKSKNMVIAALVAALGIGLSGCVWFVSHRTKGKAKDALWSYFRTMALTTLMGASISFLAEYGFLQGVVGRFEAADPHFIVNRALESLLVDPPRHKSCPDEVIMTCVQ